MKKLVSFFLILLGTGLFVAAQDSGVTSKRLNFAYVYGNPDYVDFSSLGSNVFQADVDNPMIKRKNLKSFAANFRGWRLMDEYIVDPEFFWELDTVALKGKIRTVNYEKISKYPSLEKRYKAIKPIGVNYIVCVDLNSTDQDGDVAASSFRSHQVCFRAQSYQMFWGGSRSGRAASYPGALLGWREGISTSWDFINNNSDVNRLKNIVSKFRSVSKYTALPTNTWLDIRWPDDAIDKIYEDFEEYEKEGKDLEKEYKEAKEEPKPPALAKIDPDDEMKLPSEGKKVDMTKVDGRGTVSIRDVTITVADHNNAQDDYYVLYVNNEFIGNVFNVPGGSTTHNARLRSGNNLVELRLHRTMGKDTNLTLIINGGEFKVNFTGSKNHSYAIAAGVK